MTWLFAYAELMGEHLLRDYAVQPARLQGYHRAFVHASPRLWGTPDHPGPRVGLLPGGECWGLAFDVPWSARRAMLRRLAPTEHSEEYRRLRLPVVLQDGTSQRAYVWVSRPDRIEGRQGSDVEDADLRPLRHTQRARQNMHGPLRGRWPAPASDDDVSAVGARE